MFSKITAKNYFWGDKTILEGMGRWTTKVNIIFFWEMEYRIQFVTYFLK